MNGYQSIRYCNNAFYVSQRILGSNKQSLQQYVHFISTHPYFHLTRKQCLYSSESLYNNVTLCPITKLQTLHMFNVISNISCISTVKKFSTETTERSPLTRKEKLKRAVKEYGSTVIIFHVTISLISLGICYIIISSGVDVGSLLSKLGITNTVAANAGTFVTAYAIHKVFAPARISITLGATPFIVRYLRRVGFLKTPKSS
ncbi:hypothetical protein FQA39_LY08340 [Lamprigera yunnana]|nr:hypothetical protein FQA39_LY08340 [Lamprigera yunnana]